MKIIGNGKKSLFFFSFSNESPFDRGIPPIIYMYAREGIYGRKNVKWPLIAVNGLMQYCMDLLIAVNGPMQYCMDLLIAVNGPMQYCMDLLIAVNGSMQYCMDLLTGVNGSLS